MCQAIGFVVIHVCPYIGHVCFVVNRPTLSYHFILCVYRALHTYFVLPTMLKISACIRCLCDKFVFVISIVECERWRRNDNVSAENGIFYPLSSVADCMDLCVSKSRCVAIDIWSDSCSLHINASDLLSSHTTSGVSQYVLDRSCAVSLASTMSLETVSTTPLTTRGFCHNLCLCGHI